MFGFGVWEIVLILGIVILFFGGRRIPEIARGLGSAIRNFKGELGAGAPDEGESREVPPPGENRDP